MKISLLHMFSGIVIIQAVLMAIYFLQNSKISKISNRILAALLLILAVLAYCSFILNIFLTMSPWQQMLIFGLGNLAFCIGPLLYFYIKSLLELNFSFQKKDGIHIVPFITAIILSFYLFRHDPNFYLWTNPGRIYFSSAILIQNLAYFVASLNLLYSYGLTTKLFLLYIDNSRMAWIRFFIAGYVLLWSTQLQLFVGWDVLHKPAWCPYGTSLYFLNAFLMFNAIIYIGWKKPEMFFRAQKYQNSVLKQTDKDEYQQRLVHLMDKDKLYLNPSVTLTEIARMLDIAPCYVSQIVNESFRQNFRDFVNRYRIEESKRLLIDQKQLFNILGVAQESGFNSKSAFNSAFKKHTGVTPKEFKRKASSIMIS